MMMFHRFLYVYQSVTIKITNSIPAVQPSLCASGFSGRNTKSKSEPYFLTGEPKWTKGEPVDDECKSQTYLYTWPACNPYVLIRLNVCTYDPEHGIQRNLEWLRCSTCCIDATGCDLFTERLFSKSKNCSRVYFRGTPLRHATSRSQVNVQARSRPSKPKASELQRWVRDRNMSKVSLLALGSREASIEGGASSQNLLYCIRHDLPCLYSAPLKYHDYSFFKSHA